MSLPQRIIETNKQTIIVVNLQRNIGVQEKKKKERVVVHYAIARMDLALM